jgi:hypothetical protein
MSADKTDEYLSDGMTEELINVLSKVPGLRVPGRTSCFAFEDNILSLDRPTTFMSAKDRPILFSALAWADVLLTLDSKDFGELLGSDFYGLPVLRPGAFLERERSMSRLE